MAFPSSSALARRRARHAATPRPTTSRPAAPASSTRSRRRTRCSPPASRKRALVVGGDVLSKILDWTDRSTLVLFGDGAGAVVMERGRGRRLPRLRARRRRRRRRRASGCPGSGSRKFEDPEQFVKMNGREVFKFATRVMVSSAEAILGECGKTVEDVDVYVPHQANVRIIDHAVEKLGVPAGEDGRERRTATATPRRARFRSPSRTRRTTAGSNQANWCC